MQKNNNEILNTTFSRINNYLEGNDDNQIPVVEFKTPAELSEIIDFTVKQNGVSQQEFIDMADNYLKYSVRTGKKEFLNQLYSGFNFPSFIGDVLTSLTNTSMYTYEVAPVATMIEKEMVKLMNNYAGYLEGDGIFLSGGSNANLLAMFSARNKILPESRFEGNKNVPITAFVSDQSHYSFDTAANIIGIGSKNLIKIKSDQNGRMIPSELEKEIVDSLAREEVPFFVAATCATTMLGAFDPLDKMAEICEKYNVWLHADGSFGGSILLSEKYRYLMKGIEKTDSFAWTAHKLMNIPLICSAFLVKKKGTLQHNITDINSDYIFHDIDEVEDLGKKSIQCGRHVDAVKLWFAWKYYGKDGYNARTENLIEMAKYAEQIIKSNNNLELLAPRQSFTVCFRYIPDFETDLDGFNLKLREALRKSGKIMLNYGYIDKAFAFRLVITNGDMNKTDIDTFFQQLYNEILSLEKTSILLELN